MKKFNLYLITFLLSLFLMGCKSSKYAARSNLITISKEDFQQVDDPVYTDYKAVILNENVNVGTVGLPGLPWARMEIVNFYSSDSAWKTEVEDKVLFLNDSINGEPVSVIDYTNPLRMRWDLMRKCNMWLCSQDRNGNINKRKIKKREVIHERLNDSICRVRLNIKESVSGKILLRKYYLLSPYNKVVPYYGLITAAVEHNIITFAKVNPWTFQKDIPLLQGTFKIYLPYGDGKVTKIGDGEMEVKREKTKESVLYFDIPGYTSSLSGKTMHIEHRSKITQRKADLVTVTVSNVMPLPKDSKAQPLGITITYP